jgi:hypothetical protein
MYVATNLGLNLNITKIDELHVNIVFHVRIKIANIAHDYSYVQEVIQIFGIGIGFSNKNPP